MTKSQQDLLDRFYLYWADKVRAGETSGLRQSECIVLEIFVTWLCENHWPIEPKP